MEVVLDGGHSSLLTGANGISLPLGVGTRGIGLEKLGALGIDTSDEESNTVGTTHGLAL